MLDECSIAESIENTVVDNLYVIPSNVNLAGAEIELLGINEDVYKRQVLTLQMRLQSLPMQVVIL